MLARLLDDLLGMSEGDESVCRSMNKQYGRDAEIAHFPQAGAPSFHATCRVRHQPLPETQAIDRPAESHRSPGDGVKRRSRPVQGARPGTGFLHQLPVDETVQDDVQARVWAVG